MFNMATADGRQKLAREGNIYYKTKIQQIHKIKEKDILNQVAE